MIKPHHPDKGGTIEGFSLVESARQSRKKSCGNTRPTETTKKNHQVNQEKDGDGSRMNKDDKPEKKLENNQNNKKKLIEELDKMKPRKIQLVMEI